MPSLLSLRVLSSRVGGAVTAVAIALALLAGSHVIQDATAAQPAVTDMQLVTVTTDSGSSPVDGVQLPTLADSAL